MPDAIIVAVARTPIGRAFKGSLREVRPDDLAAFAVQTALSQIPELDPTTVDDLLLGCGLPGGQQGMNMARIVAVMLGLDTVPGATVTRYCSSSLQTSRMALHAIKAGEAEVIISAGVESVSSSQFGNSDYIPGIDTVIKVGKIRGVESHGMMLSEREMELSDAHTGIVELPPDAPVGARYIDIVPDARIIYAYDMKLGEKRISVSLATITFEAEPGGTRMLFTEQLVFLDGYSDDGLRLQGTEMLLDHYELYLEREESGTH